MSVSAAFVLAAAVAAAPADPPSHGVAMVEARVTAQILPAVVVRQSNGLQAQDEGSPRHQLSRRGNTILVEFQ